MNTIGLIAGNGRFPILFAQTAKKKGYEVICIAIEGETDKDIAGYVSKIFWIKLGEFLTLLSICKQEHITKAVMAGQIKKTHIFDNNLNLDKGALSLLRSFRDNRDTRILSGVIRTLKSQGVEVISSATFLDEFLPRRGVLTKRLPTQQERSDIAFGLPLARKIAGFDIGQTIVVKNRVIVSVEAVEGTDETIKRASKLAGAGIVIIKVARPFQDMRFDIPVIGMNTIATLIETGAKVLAVEAKKTLFIDKDELIERADKNDISLIAV
ncbi:MAG: UDP-2,3-diacylglucosamine diphosphatase LpxI [Candidatus Omnitrophota bacterium]